MPLIPIPNNSDLTTYFTTGQRKALDTLGDVIVQGIINYINANPNVLPISLDDLTDVDIPSPVNGDKVRFDGSEYVGVLDTLDSLTDVTITSATTRDEIEWNGSAWVNKSPFPQIVTESTTSRTAVLTDANSYIRFTNGSATTFTIPPQASVAWRDGSQIEFEQGGGGVVTVQGGSGVTIRLNAALTTATNGQYAVGGLKRVASNEWVLFGNLVPA